MDYDLMIMGDFTAGIALFRFRALEEARQQLQAGKM